jgi:hypothetical protein
MKHGGWILLAKLVEGDPSWIYSFDHWTSDSTFGDITSIGAASPQPAKSQAWSSAVVSELRMDADWTAPGSLVSVVVQNSSPQPMSVLMSGAAQTLTVARGSLSQFVVRCADFQGGCGEVDESFHANADISTSEAPCCDLHNKVRFGSLHGEQNCNENGGANSGFAGAGGTTMYRDCHVGSCCNYGAQPEIDYSTSGENFLIFGK